MPVAVPQGVDVSITADQITVKGANGTLTRSRERAGRGPQGRRQVLTFAPANDSMEANAMSGTMRALVNNMVIGVTQGLREEADAGRRGLPCRRPQAPS